MEKMYDQQARRKWANGEVHLSHVRLAYAGSSSLALMPRQNDIEAYQPHDYEDADRNVMRHRTKAPHHGAGLGPQIRSMGFHFKLQIVFRKSNCDDIGTHE